MTARFDVLIIGAGMCGSTVARSLGDAGYMVGLIDPQSECRPVFKAEKVEPDQVELLRSLNVFDTALRVATPIGNVSIGRMGKVERELTIHQYGVAYEDLVNAMRWSLPGNVTSICGKAISLIPSATAPAVRLATGESITARIVIVASGVSGISLTEQLGVERRVIRQTHSLCCGFDMEPIDREHFDIEALTYHCEDRRFQADYITIFPIKDRIRANLFHYGTSKDAWIREFSKNPEPVVKRFFPRLKDVIGPWRAKGAGQTVSIQLYTTEMPCLDGVLLLGDSFQSVCPATGTGLSKVLTDVYLAANVYIPEWLEKECIATSDVRSFYSDTRKSQVDQNSIQLANTRRNMIINSSLRWRLKRSRAKVSQIARRVIPSAQS